MIDTAKWVKRQVVRLWNYLDRHVLDMVARGSGVDNLIRTVCYVNEQKVHHYVLLLAARHARYAAYRAHLRRICFMAV